MSTNTDQVSGRETPLVIEPCFICGRTPAFEDREPEDNYNPFD